MDSRRLRTARWSSPSISETEVLRWSPEAGLATVYAGAPLDFPASIVSRDGVLVVSNAAFLTGAEGAPSVVALSNHR